MGGHQVAAPGRVHLNQAVATITPTSAIATRDGSAGSFSGSTRTGPVKYAAGPFPEGLEPLRLISMVFCVLFSII